MSGTLPRKVVIATVALVLALSGFVGLSAQAPQAPAGRGGRGGGGPQVTSPEVSADRHITFRILAPNATEVSLRASDIPSAARESATFAKDDQGVWSATTGPVDPGAYRYTFVVDGTTVIDPRSPSVSESNTNVWSMVYVPGSPLMDTRQVPRGAVAAVTYYSDVLGRFRRMHVYTPPGYEEGGSERYPVFYLLHGAGDSDDSWTSVGRAGFILDNLIAEGRAKPMVVVMPAGHTSFANGNGEGRDAYFEDFTTAVKPYIEEHYRVLTDRPNTAIAGLSMGGSQTLNIAFSRLAEFAYIGVYSSGASLGRGGGAGMEGWEAAHRADLQNASLKPGTKLVWFSTGVDDGLIANSRATVEMLRSHGFDATFEESAGGHTWLNWRDYLIEFAPQLFQ